MDAFASKDEEGRLDLRDAEIVHIDLLDRSNIIISFSNGVSVRLLSEAVKDLAISSSLERVGPGEEMG